MSTLRLKSAKTTSMSIVSSHGGSAGRMCGSISGTVGSSTHWTGEGAPELERQSSQPCAGISAESSRKQPAVLPSAKRTALTLGRSRPNVAPVPEACSEKRLDHQQRARFPLFLTLLQPEPA